MSPPHPQKHPQTTKTKHSDGEDQLPGSIATFQAAAEQPPGRPGVATSDVDDAAAGGPRRPAAATVGQVMQSTHSPEPRPFTWSECHMIVTDAADVLVRQPSVWPRVVRLQVRLQQPLLFWAERHSWLWHRKWTLPKLHVRVFCEGNPAMSGAPPPPLHVIVSAGTLRGSGEHGGGGDGGGDGGGGGGDGGGVSLHDQGLGGEFQRRLVQGETIFSSLLFKHTSFNCGGRPFRLVVTVLAPSHHPLAARPAG